MTKGKAVLLAAAAAGLLFWFSARGSVHQAWLQERQTTAYLCRETGTALMKEAAFSPHADGAFHVSNGCARYTLTADEGGLEIVMDDKTQELIALVLHMRDDREKMTVFGEMLACAGIRAAYVWKNADGAEMGNDPERERVDTLYALAADDVLIRNGYQITVRTDQNNRTQMILKKQNASLPAVSAP